MGTTILVIEASGEGVDCWFSCKKGGAAQWQWIVDAFRDVALALEQEGCDISWPDGHQTMGKKASVRMDVGDVSTAVKRWRRNEVVRRALRDRSVVVSWDLEAINAV